MSVRSVSERTSISHAIASRHEVESQTLGQRDLESLEEKFSELRVGNVDRFPIRKD